MNILKTLKEKSLDKGIRVENYDNKLITFLNPYSFLYYRKNIKMFSRFDFIFIDGILLVFLMKLISKRVVRISFDMTSLAPKVFKDLSLRNKSVFFVGAKQNEIEEFIETIKNKLGFEIQIKGFRNGYFKNNETQNFIKELTSVNPDIIIVGMGTPMQEQFLLRMRDNGWKGTGYTCGGFFHQTTTKINYYPKFIDRYNLRWLYRIYDEPKLLKRYTIEYPKSIGLFTFDLVNYFLKK